MEETAPDYTCTEADVTASGRDMQVDDTLKSLTKLDLDTAYASEKLVNLHVLLMHLLAWDNDLEAMAMTVEKASVFDLLSAILESELREVEKFLDTLKEQVVDASHKISSCRHMKELFLVMEGKLRDSEESLKQSQEQVSEIKIQLAKLLRTFSYIKHGKSENEGSMELSRDDLLRDIRGKARRQTDLKQRQVLRMLEKSLSRELDLEKKLSELGLNEEQLRLKLHHTEQVACRMEEASEFIWGRFLEAENASEVHTGISMELLGRLHILQFNLNGSLQREAALKSKFEDCFEQLQSKDLLLKKLEATNAENVKIASEVLPLWEKVKSLEEQLKNAKVELKSANSSREESLEQLAEMENAMESMKESLYEAEHRAESAETRVKQLTDTNLELTEEINFLKEAESKNAKKVTSLEKQLRELEIQAQNAKASSEAGQEQQNMLYSAIWDMETLIEDLKSKVSKAESKTESAEEHCIILSETNFELNKELNLLKEKMESLEVALHQGDNVKEKAAKEINSRNKLMMDMLMQLAMERERIQAELQCLTKENGVLKKTLHNTGNILQTAVSYHEDGIDKELHLHCKSKAFPNSLQEDELIKDELERETEVEPSSSGGASRHSNLEAARSLKTGSLKTMQVFTAAFVLILSLFAVYLLNKTSLLLEYHV